MKVGIRFSDIKVQNGIICDGHHRYIASLLAGVEMVRVPSILKSEHVGSWKSIVFDDEDWDTEDKIISLNEVDARYNDMPLEQLLELLK